MSAIKLSFKDLYSIRHLNIENLIKMFTSDDSENSYFEKILTRTDFQPDSFTVFDRLSNPDFLASEQHDGKMFIKSLITSEIERIESEGLIIFEKHTQIIDYLFDQLMLFFNFSVKDKPLAALIYNQELIDVIKNLITFCIFCDTTAEIQNYKSFNELGAKIIPIILKNYLSQISDIKQLFMYSIASGLIGLDIKSSRAAASSFANIGIELKPLRYLDPEKIARKVFYELSLIVSRNLAIDYWDEFINFIMSEGQHRIVWFTDDYIETLLDLYCIGKICSMNPALSIALVPKNGYYGNDTSYKDVQEMLKMPVFDDIKPLIESNKLHIQPNGPRMGAVNLKKIANSIVDEILACDIIYVKGCRAHELIQGGINKLSFTSFVVTREYTQAETGLDARLTPIVFLKSEAGEYAYWGFKGIGKRKKKFADGREINICYSTTEEHELRKKTSDGNIIVKELNQLSSIFEKIDREYLYAYNQETKLLVNRISEITQQTYSAVAQRYSDIRQQEPNQEEALYINEVLSMVRQRVRAGFLGDKNGIINFLDVGTGHGRDLRYLLSFKDVNAKGIDNAKEFIKILEIQAENGLIPNDSFAEMDMREMASIQTNSYDAVRHNATLLHLPMLPNRVGADEAVAETYRILKPHGILYVLVKSGHGLEVTDTGEGLGGRIFQYHSQKTLTELLSRNGFYVFEMRKRFSERPKGTVEWILAIAEKLNNF